MGNLYVLIGFDVEHDAEPLSDRCEGVKKGIPKILDILDYFDINCNFNILGCIIDEHLDLFKQIKAKGHEIGSHSYDHEALGFMDNKYTRNQIEKSTNAIRKKFGESPLTFRAPYLIGNTFLIKTLDKFDYLVDSSNLIAHHNTQLLPYHPSDDDWTLKGNLNILEIPISSDPDNIDSEKSDLWPWWRVIGAKYTKKKINTLISRQEKYGKDNVITFYLHPWEFIELEKTGVEVPKEHQQKIFGGNGEKAIQSFKEILLWLKKQKNATFLPMKDFREIWDEIIKK